MSEGIGDSGPDSFLDDEDWDADAAIEFIDLSPSVGDDETDDWARFHIELPRDRDDDESK